MQSHLRIRETEQTNEPEKRHIRMETHFKILQLIFE